MKYLYIDPSNDSLKYSIDEPTVVDMVSVDDGDMDILRISDDGSIEKASNIDFEYAEDDDEENDPASYECRWVPVEEAIVEDNDDGNPQHI